MKKWIDSLIQSPEVVAVPIMTHPGIELIGKTVKDAVSNGQVHYQAVKALSEKYPSAACTLIMDLTVEAEAFGAPIVMPEDEIPSVSGRLLSSAEDIEALAIPPLSAGRVPQYLMANMLSARNITDRPVFAGCIGPFSLAGRLYDMNEIMMGIYIEPDAMHLLLDKCTTFIINYCQAIKKTGVAGVMMAEPASGLLSDEDAMQFSTQYVQRVVEAVQDDNFTLVLHNCGNTGHCTNSMIASGARALHFGNMIDMEQVMSEVPSSILVMGNLDPVSIFKQATPEKVFEETSALLEKMKPYNNFVLSSGCDLPPEVPFANIDAFFQALNKH